MQTPTTALIIPTFNSGKYIKSLFEAIGNQTLKPDHVLVIDSSSSDNTRELLTPYRHQLHVIPQKDFDHSGTRRLGTEMINADIYIFLTDDAIPDDKDAFKNIVEALQNNEKMGCAYGRQVPRPHTNPISRHARLFNYPDLTQIKKYEDREKLGIKTCFHSDSFAAYKKSALDEIGGFPKKLPVGEDVVVAAKMLLKGKELGYVAEAKVTHSHELTLKQEFKRYRAIGGFHARESWILDEFGHANNEGLAFVKSEIAYLIKNKAFSWIPRAIASTFTKYLGYKAGFYLDAKA